jgi:ubiquinone/menaquinone biosynthesis C-methylase UbiE
MQKQLNLIQELHKSTKRNYLHRMNDSKVDAMEIARKFQYEYWDGDRRYGFGGYRYIPDRWKHMAKNLIDIYSLTNTSKILDIGCGKGFLLYELQRLIPEIEICGLDISKYALENAHPEFKGKLLEVDARLPLPFDDKFFDLTISINTIHNFNLPDVVNVLSEMQRVGKQQYLVVEAYRNLTEFFNLQCWALTAPTLIMSEEWIWLFSLAKYFGDYEFIFFE